MLRAALAFFVLALIALIAGVSGLAWVSLEVARTLLWVFLVLALISFAAGAFNGRSGSQLR